MPGATAETPANTPMEKCTALPAHRGQPEHTHRLHYTHPGKHGHRRRGRSTDSQAGYQDPLPAPLPSPPTLSPPSAPPFPSAHRDPPVRQRLHTVGRFLATPPFHPRPPDTPLPQQIADPRSGDPPPLPWAPHVTCRQPPTPHPRRCLRVYDPHTVPSPEAVKLAASFKGCGCKF